MLKNRLFVRFSLIGLALLLTYCGKNLLHFQTWKEAAPFFAVASPTAESLPLVSHELDPDDWSKVSATFDFPGLRALFRLFRSDASADLENSRRSLPLSDLIHQTKELWEKSPYEAAQAVDFEANPLTAPRCFGAQLEFNGQSVPTGKLGLLSPTEPPTRGSQACAAAQMNYLVSLAGAANAALKTVMVLVATARDTGDPLSDEKKSIDVTRYMPRLGKQLTVTKGTLSRIANKTSHSYLTRIELSQGGRGGFLLNYHTPFNAQNTSFEGVLKGVLPHTSKASGVSGFRAMAMTYRSDGKTINYLLEMAANREKVSDVFFEEQRINFSLEAFGEEGYRFLASFDPKTNEGSMKVAWMDDARDSASRIFEVKVGLIEKKLLGGYAYFGFGNKLAGLEVSKQFWISKFFPGWPMGEAVDGKCQAQKFSQQQVGGPFLSSEFHGPFVPTPTGTGSGVFSGNYDFNGATTIQALDFVVPGAYGNVEVPVPHYIPPPA